LAAADALSQRRLPPLILEQDRQVGGLSKTVSYRGFYFDIGGHRFFTKNPEVMALWQQTLGDAFLVRSRLSRIYYRGKFFHYPLRAANALAGLGACDSLRVLLSYAYSRLFPRKPEISFEDWVFNRFGRVLFNIFFKTYTEKVWGIPCREISADWAAQRIRNLSLGRAVLNALGLGRDGKVASLIEQFHYPRRGPGQMYEALAANIAAQGGEFRHGRQVVEVRHAHGRVIAVKTWGEGGEMLAAADQCFSSMPITELAAKMQPAPPDAVLDAARALRYRSIIAVNLLLRTRAPLPDNWIYLHDPSVRAGRLQLYQNWSPFMIPDNGASSITFEYFSFEGDGLWDMADPGLIRLAREDLRRLQLPGTPQVYDGMVVRYPKAYPIYAGDYQRHLAALRGWLGQFPNLFCIGRYGQFRYNNMDHSILTGRLAVRRMSGEAVDPWSVNADAEYLEENRAG
jgi:protoporphyrinogen oxidase